jgi:hypothetical protein
MIFSWFEQVATMVFENRSYRKQAESIQVGGQTMGQKWKKWNEGNINLEETSTICMEGCFNLF